VVLVFGVGFGVGALVIADPIEPPLPDMEDMEEPLLPLLDIEYMDEPEVMDERLPDDVTVEVWRTRSEKAETILLFTFSRPRMLPAATTSISNRKHKTFICRQISLIVVPVSRSRRIVRCI
jgi:hypothetical protein